jgi:hypothetical protein
MPVLMVVQSVESMAQVKDIGIQVKEEEKKQKTKEIVAWALNEVFFLIPFVGEVAGAMEWAAVTLVRLAALIGLAGDVAMTAVDIVENLAAALIAALHLLIPGGAGRTPKNVGDTIRAKKALGNDGLGSIGDVFKRNDETLQTILDICKKS